MFERFTDRARKVMALANQEAQRLNHEYIGTEHILLGLVKEGSGVGANVLNSLDVNLDKVRLAVEKFIKPGPDMVERCKRCKVPQTPRAKKVVEFAIEEARNLNHNYVGTEHFLLGLLREHDGVAARVLMYLGLRVEEVREEVLNVLGVGVEADTTAGMTAREFVDAGEKFPDVRFELVNGKPIITNSGSTPAHGYTVVQIISIVHRYIDEHDLGTGFARVNTILGPHDVRRPDMVFLAKHRRHLIGRKAIEGPPDLCIEVINPGSEAIDRVEKLKQYQETGVANYWIIGPGGRTVQAYQLQDKSYTLAAQGQATDVVRLPPFPELDIPLGKLWL